MGKRRRHAKQTSMWVVTEDLPPQCRPSVLRATSSCVPSCKKIAFTMACQAFGQQFREARGVEAATQRHSVSNMRAASRVISVIVSSQK